MAFFIMFIGIIIVVGIISNLNNKTNKSNEHIHYLHSTNDLNGNDSHTISQGNNHCADNSSTTSDSSCSPSGD